MIKFKSDYKKLTHLCRISPIFKTTQIATLQHLIYKHHQRDGSFDGVFCEKCLIISQMIVEEKQGPHFFNSSYFSFCSLPRNQP